MKHCLMCCPLNTNVQVSKIIIINLNFNKKKIGIYFLNKTNGKLENSFIDLSKKTIFWDIQNRIF